MILLEERSFEENLGSPLFVFTVAILCLQFDFTHLIFVFFAIISYLSSFNILLEFHAYFSLSLRS